VITDLVFNHAETCQVLLGQLTPPKSTVIVLGGMTSNYLHNQFNSYHWMMDGLDPCSDPAYSTTTSLPLKALSRSVMLPPEESSKRRRRRRGSGWLYSDDWPSRSCGISTGDMML